jgi:hypothetical protein
MRGIRWFLPLLSVALVGCGLRVPDIQELGGRAEGQRLVQAILFNITCELRDAMNELREGYPQGTFLDSWGIQTTLTLTNDEKGAIAPGASWTPLSPAEAVFTLGAGVSFSSDATRMNVINSYYLASDLRTTRCSDEARPNGPYLLQSNLKLSEWLFTAVSAQVTNSVNFKTTALAVPANVLQHQVTFAVETSGSLNPKWVLSRVTVNPDGTTLFSTSRNRKHDLLITMAPANKDVVAEVMRNGRKIKVAGPGRQAADIHFSALVATGIQSALRR